MIASLGHKDAPFEWIDVTDPTGEELDEVARRYGLHAAAVADCLQPGHLPKYEEYKGYTFIIIRIYHAEKTVEADTVQELTNKVAIFISDSFIITIHRRVWARLEFINEGYVCTGDCKDTRHVLNEVVKASLHTYDEPGEKLTQNIEFYEKRVFLTTQRAPLLKGMYFLKRKLDVIRRLLLLTYDIIDKIDGEEVSNAYTRDIRDLYVKQKSLFDALSENTNHLLNIYFNISAQRTNETVRVLTVFSVFFMPLTFIVGVYGMNFQFMPELRSRWGYPVVMVAMAAVVVAIYIWFKKKKWL